MALLRNRFFNDSTKKLYVAATITVIAAVISAVSAFYNATKKAEPRFFAIDNDGSIVEMTPLEYPNQSDAVVAGWIEKALIDTFDFHYFNINQHINEATMKWFTAKGATQFVAMLKDNRFDAAVVENKLLVGLTLEHTPLLLQKVERASTGTPYSWTFAATGKITYRTATESYSDSYNFRVTVDRRSLFENAMGLGIAQLIMTERRQR
ncbi:DotI/IcmL/TraM family protein [Ferrimonas marina]|uniref:Intracellular multiplication protein IcmL n=1 Tax=Ferrimonas marina TaxID=299255 RepID=A0A1M5TKB4_9GAMM|nr:DotI/IcmL/TraM family protein [Ferrimonas marina]SHH51111.1 intracellular multiplication protein IcmL [Ferrimonas marina]